MDERFVQRLTREMAEEAERRGAPEGFPPLPPIPMARYTDSAFHDLERETLWRSTWLLAAHRDELPAPGHYRLWDRVGRQLLLVNGRDGEIRAFRNTCRHRGASLVEAQAGCVRQFACRFHAWTYDLDGRLRSVPGEADFPGLDKATLSLTPVRCEAWGRWIFVNDDPDAPELSAFLGALPQELADFDPGRLRLLDRHEVEIACNWKLVTDAFIEVYHLRVLHPNTIHSLLDPARTTIGLLPGGHSRMVTGIRETMHGEGFAREAPVLSGLGPFPRVANLSWFVFPNALIPTDLRGFPILQFWPVDARRTSIEVSWHVGDWGEGEAPEHWRNAVRAFDFVLTEDLGNLSAMQRAVDSGGSTGARLGYQERRIYHLHEAIDRAIGVDRVPEALRVVPVLDPHVEAGR